MLEKTRISCSEILFLLLIAGLKNSNRRLAEACIRSLKTFYTSHQTPVDPIYEVNANVILTLVMTLALIHKNEVTPKLGLTLQPRRKSMYTY